jgi:hypothetical protein
MPIYDGWTPPVKKICICCHEEKSDLILGLCRACRVFLEKAEADAADWKDFIFTREIDRPV